MTPECHEQLAAQKFLADFERAVARMPDTPPENLPEALAGAMKGVLKPLQDAAKPTQDALKAAWAAASAWEEVPALAAGQAAKPPAKPAAEEKPR